MVGSAALAFMLLTVAVGADGPPAVRLTLDAGPATCLDETSIRDAVAARLGYRPFRDDASDRVEIHVMSAGSGFAARIERFDAQGRSLGRRDLTGVTCATLTSSVALALSIAIDPLSLTRPAPPTPPAPPPPPPTQPAPPAAPSPSPPAAPPEPAGPPLGVGVQAGGLAALGLASSISGGVTVGGELRWPGVSIGLEGEGILPSTTSVGGGGSVQVATLFATLVPCLRLSYFGACALVAAGAVQVDGVGLVDAAHQAAPFVGVGARGIGELPLWGPLGVRLQVDLLAPLAHTTVLAGSEQIWTTPTLAGQASLALTVRLR